MSLECVKCGRKIPNRKDLTRYIFKDDQGKDFPDSSQTFFGTDHLDLSKPICSMCAGVYKKSWTDYQIELAMKQLDEVNEKK